MGATLRTWMGSWRVVWVTIGCLVFLAAAEVVPRWVPMMASWPFSVRLVIIGLEYIAIFTVEIILFYALARCLIRLFKPYLDKVWMPFEARSDKAKEKIADSIMSISTAIFTATLIGVSVFPFTAVLNALVSGTNPLSSLISFAQAGSLEGWTVPILLCLFFLPAMIGHLMRMEALDIYDEISRTSSPPHAPTGAPMATVTPERPPVPDSGPPVYVKATERRRRHRAK
jgi:hypothetical protein